ncbi:MAG: hypothetical protein IPM56_02125 [Ignavibacteriales bacterium]|nr:MAG: hypothetical protein IPM56_02125 [Ignavibacteriales bacterium]
MPQKLNVIQSKNLLIGIDGGGTKTNFLFAEDNLNTLHTSSAGASNLTTYGIENVFNLILNNIIQFIDSVDLSSTQNISVVAGLAGAGRPDEAESLQKILRQKLNELYSPKIFIKIVTDAVITLEGAFTGKAGAILIAGTGSILFGKDKDDNFFRAGGFGKIIGDEGSGYSIGRKALQLYSHFLDNRKEKTKLDELISESMKVNDSGSLIKNIYSGNFDIASIAPLVLQAADENDKSAQKILNEGCDELVNHIPPYLKFTNSNESEICLLGSLISNDNFYSKLLKKKIKENFPGIKIIQPQHSPEYGAVLIAKKLIGTESR